MKTEDTQNTILIVDDSPDVLNLLFDYLKRAGFKILVAKDGESAIERISHTKPDIILLDIMMPNIDGFETCRLLKENEETKDIPVIFLTALSDTVDRVKGFELGAVDYITKPIRYAELLARINTHLTIHNLQRDLIAQNEHLQEENKMRRRVQDALRESRLRYRLLAENSTDMISRQTMDGVYRYVSPACRTILGYEIEEMIGHSAYEFFHPEDLKVIQELAESGQEWPAASTITYRARAKDKNFIWLETVSKIVYDPETNQAEEIIAVSRDVTGRKQMEEALRKQNEELDAFAHTVAHDLKNPLGAITNYAQLLLMGSSKMDVDRVQNILHKLDKTGQQTVSIVESLLLLAGVRKGEAAMNPFNMADIVIQSQRRLALMIEEFQGEIVLPRTWPVAIGYAPWIEEVWANYLSNGLKYGGRPPYLELGYTHQPDDTIRFWIRDNGKGLTPEQQIHIFTEFTRLNEVRIEGYGLGLSIVRRIIDKLGGQVGVESEVGKGSVFYFTLPGA